jgi:hypothetical protein
MASSMAGPPAAPAGKNLASLTPRRDVAERSDGVMMPSANSKVRRLAASTISGSNRETETGAGADSRAEGLRCQHRAGANQKFGAFL